jgi:putative ABC transport system substrate-binding protein
MSVLSLVAVMSVVLAASGSPVVVYEARVAQYKEAAEAAKGKLPGAVDADPESVTAGLLQQAPVVVAVGQKALNKVKTLAPGVPVVFTMVLSPGPDLVNGNVSGVPLEADPAAVLEFVRSLGGKLKRVGVVYDAKGGSGLLETAQRAASERGLTLVPKAVASPDQVRDAVAAMASGIDVLWLPTDPRLFSRELCSYLLGFAAERNLPLVGFLDNFTQSGALASIAADYNDIGLVTGQYANEVMNRVEKARLPVGPLRYSKGRLTVNVKTASALGLDVPGPMLDRAKTVFR